MRVLVTNEQRYVGHGGGVFAPSGGHAFYERYLTVFDEVLVVARVEPVDDVPAGWCRVDGHGVVVHPIPAYVGPRAYLRLRHSVRAELEAALSQADAVLYRLDSQLATVLESVCRPAGRPIAVEVVADPKDAFTAGAGYPVPWFWSRYFARNLRRQVARAVAVGYVTEAALQRRYPASPQALTRSYSSVELLPDAFVAQARTGRVGMPLRVVTVGSMDRLLKGPDVLLDAVAECRRSGLPVQLEFVGGGALVPDMKARAASLGIADNVRFLGSVPRDRVRQALDEADLFVLPSRGEGLPRALLEAMARGLPAVATAVNGIPEVLPNEDIVPRTDPGSLARKIMEVSGDEARLARMSERNLTRARDFGEDILVARRLDVYQALRDETERWLHGERVR